MRHISIWEFLAGISLFAGLGATFFSVFAYADQKSASLTAFPAILEVAGLAGDEAGVSFKLTNNTDSIMPIHLSTRNMAPRSGQPEEYIAALSAKSWLVLEEKDFILNAHQTKEVKAKITIPAEAPAGGRYADIVVHVLSLEGSTDLLDTKPELVVQVLVTVGGSIDEQIILKNKNRTIIFLKAGSRIEMSYEIENIGNTHNLFLPELLLMKGQNIESAHQDSPVILLPKEKREISIPVTESSAAGVYKAGLKASYGTPLKTARSKNSLVIITPFHPMWLASPLMLFLGCIFYKNHSRFIAAFTILKTGNLPESKKNTID